MHVEVGDLDLIMDTTLNTLQTEFARIVHLTTYHVLLFLEVNQSS